MKKFLTRPWVQWVWLHIFFQQWVFMAKDDPRFRVVSNVHHALGDPDVSETYKIGWWKKLPVISHFVDAIWRSFVMLEWKKEATFRVDCGFRLFIACDDIFGNRLVRLGKPCKSFQTIKLLVGREDADFFLVSFKYADQMLEPRLEFLEYEDVLSSWQKFYNML